MVVGSNLYEQSLNEQALNLLKKARNQIADINHWCQGVYFSGSRCCAMGAILKHDSYNKNCEVYNRVVRMVCDVALDKFDHGSIMSLNDSESLDSEEAHRRVIKVFDIAIAILEEE